MRGGGGREVKALADASAENAIFDALPYGACQIKLVYNLYSGRVRYGARVGGPGRPPIRKKMQVFSFPIQKS